MDKIMNKMLKNGIEHPARIMDFADLTKGLFAEVDNGNVSVVYHSEFPHLALFKYTQDCVVDRKWNKFSLMARGLILDLKEKKVVATPFPKFFNYGEIEEGSKSIIEPEFTVTEKMDGCCHQDVKLETEDGSKTIKEICDSKYKGKVLSYNIYTNEMEIKEILAHSILDESKDWYELETENGNTIKLTGNHKVYLPELNCYRRIDELKGDEKILLKK